MELHERLLKTTEELVRIRSTPEHPENMVRAVSYVERFFAGAPFTISRYDRNGRPSIVVTSRDTRQPRILLQGHLDVVEGRDDQFAPRKDHGKLYGRGTSDMKAFDAVAMHLLRDLAAENEDLDIGLMLTTDEEEGGNEGARFLEQQGYTADVLINGDAGYNYALVYGQKGIIKLRLTAETRPGRFPCPWEGRNALQLLLDGYRRLLDLFPDQEKASAENNWHSVCSPEDLRCEREAVNPPHRASLTVRIYFTEDLPVAEYLQRIERHVPELRVELLSCAERVYLDREGPRLLRLREIMERRFDRPIDLKAENGSSDAKFFVSHRIPILILKVPGENHHADGEFIHLDGLEPTYRSLKDFVMEETRREES